MKSLSRNADDVVWAGDDAGRKPTPFAVGLVAAAFVFSLIFGVYFGLVYMTVRLIRYAWEH